VPKRGTHFPALPDRAKLCKYFTIKAGTLMKNLLLIRHAKSSWDDPSLNDRDRTLNKRGKKDAPAMGRWLMEKNLSPGLFLSSPAKRALKTAKLIAEELGYPKKKIEVREAIYMQGLDALLELIGELDDGLSRVYLVGHNPVLTDLANRLTGAGIQNVPTCGIVSVEFALPSWRDCVREGGRLALFERPAKPKADPPQGEEFPSDDIIGT
jgi:phosphohistidine phosphatase